MPTMKYPEQFEEAENCMTCRKYKEAEQLFTEMIDTFLVSKSTANEDVNDIDNILAVLYSNRGFALYKQVEFNKAKQDYTEALKYDSSLAVTLYNRGTIHYRLGDFALAVLDMEKAVFLQYDNKEFQLGLEESRKQLRKTNV